MGTRWRAWADRYGVAVGYLAGLLGAAALLASRPVATRSRWLDWASTNLANLRGHPVGALVSSAFVVDGTILGWLLLAAVALGAAGVTLGAWRTLLVISAAHVVGTLISEDILRYQIGAGQAPPGAALIRDIGPSYVVVAALVVGIGYGPWLARVLCLLGFAVLAPDLFGGLSRWEVSAVGHVCSIVIGLVLGGLLYRTRRRIIAALAPA